MEDKRSGEANDTGARDREADNATSFEGALERLETAIRDLESGRLSLDESLSRYEAGLAAWKRCHEFLEGAKQRIETIRAGAGGEPALSDASALAGRDDGGA